MPATYTLISSNVLSSSAASVTFSAIPATYTDLVLRISVRSDRPSQVFDIMKIQFNSDTATNYSMTYVYADGSSASSGQRSSTSSIDEQFINASSTTADTFSSIELYIPSYQANANKPFSSSWATENNSAANNRNGASAMLWRNTATISSILLTPNTGPNFVSSSSFYLYGISNA